MDFLIALPVRLLIAFLQSLSLARVAKVGRFLGSLAYFLDGRHRRKTIENLAAAFPEKSKAEVIAIARENFRRIGESYCSAIKTASMSWEEIQPLCEVVHLERLPKFQPEHPSNCILAIGHFANFEVWAKLGKLAPGFQLATTYRGLDVPALNKLLQELRMKSGSLFFERRSEGAALRAALARSGIILGILSDQHAGDHGVHVPFFGRLCSTTPAPAVFALRYRCPLHVGICYRTTPGRWRVELSEAIPIMKDGEPRSSTDIMGDVNRLLEEAVRRDPANWFWVHNRWKLKLPPQPPATPQ